MPRSLVPVLVLIVSLQAAGTAQQPSAPPAGATDPQGRFGTGTTAVMIDVVVRDKQGRPVTNLTATDFELYEDDVRQEIGAMTMVAPQRAGDPAAGASGSATAAAGSGSAPPPAAQASRRGVIDTPTFVALAFDRLAPEARALAYKGALAYLETASASDFAGVFLIDQSLSTIQTYTNDRAKLRAAIDEAASRATSGYGRDGARVKSGAELDPATSPTAGAESAGPGFSATGGLSDPHRAQMSTRELIDQVAGGDPSEAMLRALANRMERSYDAMVRDQQGYATTNALSAIVHSLGLLPGRKTVVFFAESLAIPPNVLPRFDAVVAMANQVNVSIYSIDAAGLRVHSTQSTTSRELGSLASDASEQSLLPDTGGGGGAWLKGLEQNEDALRKDPNVSLRMLAERTGGFLLNNTNDLQQAFRTIDSDRRFHYLLTYAPKNGDFRGEWRNVTVKVPRRSVVIRARSGYVASRTPGAIPTLEYETAVLGALEQRPLPRAVPLHAAAFNMPDAKGPGRLAVLVSVDTAAVTLQPNAQNDAWVTDFTVLARIKDASGAVVRKASEPYRLSGPIADIEKAKQGSVLFFRQPDLPPGNYMLEAGVHDAIGQRAGARFVPFVVPEHKPNTLSAGSLVIVQRTERVPAGERSGDNPLFCGDLLIYPNLGEPLMKSVTHTVSFFIRVNPAPGGGATTATLELLQRGTPAGQVPIELASPNAQGVIEHSAQLPLANFPAGTYTLRLTLTQVGEPVVREARFTVVD